MMGDMMAGMGAWMLLWGVLFVVLMGLAVAGAVSLGRALMRRSRPQAPSSEEPRELLQRRYAAGEIDEDEYLRRLSGLDQP